MKRRPFIHFISIMLTNIYCCYCQTPSTLNLSRIYDISNIHIAYDINLLQKGEFVELIYWTHGCNMRKPLERSLIINKIENKYLISFCTCKIELSEKEFTPIINEFEQSLLLISPKDMCTTSTKILIKTPHNVFIGFDGSCKWDGFIKLTKVLFDEYPHEPNDVICPVDW